MSNEPSNTPCSKCKFLKSIDMGGFGCVYQCKMAKKAHHDPVHGTSYTYMDLPEARGGNHECYLFMPKLFTRIHRWFTKCTVIERVEVSNEK